MNWVGIGIILVCVTAAINGYRRGLVRTIVAMISFILVMVVAMIINPILEGLFVNVTGLDQKIKEHVTELVIERMEEPQESLGRNEEIDFIQNLGLPSSVKEDLIENNNDVIYEDFGVSTFKGYIASYLADVMASAVVLILSLIIAFIVVHLFGSVLDEIAGLPGLNLFNKVGGLGLGLIKGMVYVWIFLLVVVAASGTGWGSTVMRLVQEDIIAGMFYDNNPLISFVMDFLVM